MKSTHFLSHYIEHLVCTWIPFKSQHQHILIHSHIIHSLEFAGRYDIASVQAGHTCAENALQTHWQTHQEKGGPEPQVQAIHNQHCPGPYLLHSTRK